MRRRLKTFSRLLAAFPAFFAAGPARRRRGLIDLANLPDSIRYDIGISDTSPVVRGCPRRPNQF